MGEPEGNPEEKLLRNFTGQVELPHPGCPDSSGGVILAFARNHFEGN